MNRVWSIAILAIVFALSAFAQTPVTNAFTYQGRLTDGNHTVEGSYDFRFRLYDAAAGGTQVGNPQTDSVTVVDGLFTLTLNDFSQFGAAAFDGNVRWIEIDVREAGTIPYVTLAPRQPLTASPFAIHALNGYWSRSGANVYYNAGRVGIGTSSPIAQLQVSGLANTELRVHARAAFNLGGTASLELRGDRALALPHTVGRIAMIDRDDVSVAEMLYTDANQTGNDELEFRVTGQPRMALRDDGALLLPIAGRVGIGTTTPAAPLHVGAGTDAEPVGGGFLVLGSLTSASIALDNNEIMARNNGVVSDLFLNHDGGNVLIGAGGGAVGIGTTTPSEGKVHVVATSQRGIFAQNDSGGIATVRFQNIGIGPAAIFDGNVSVLGNLSKSGGSFRIDHPLDPANKYLYHSFVESPDMKNLYDGVVVTDEHGYATVEMPNWFEPLNRDFRYQLTVMDAADDQRFVLAKVVREIAGGSFTIRTSRGGTHVSWQVTGTRQDLWAEAHRIPVEVAKSAHERGKYLHPDLYRLPREMSIGDYSHASGDCPKSGTTSVRSR